MSQTPWTTPGPITKPERRVDAEAYRLQATYTTLIGVSAQLDPRSVQAEIGSSELGYACDRRIAYRLAGTPATNQRDPLVSLIGKGWHLVMADTFGRLARLFPGRFLIETPVRYRGIPGTVDLYDRVLHTVVDWKTSTKDKISHVRSQWPAASYVTQVQTYAAGLAEAGHEVTHVALLYVPRDGKRLDDMWPWRERFDRTAADTAVDRVDALRGKDPATVAAAPDRLCGWCSHYLPGSTDLAIGCPGSSS